MSNIIFSILFLVFPFFTLGQTAIKSTYTAYVNYPDYSVKVEVSSLSSKIHVKDELEYHWYASNKIFKTKGGCDGKILNGDYTSFYLSNNLKEKGFFKSGLKNGVWVAWFENGMMHEKLYWRKGLLSGEYRRFNEKGELLLKANYKKGKLSGNYTTYENGKILNKSKYKHGVKIIKKEKVVVEKKPSKDLKRKLQILFQKKIKKEKNLEADDAVKKDKEEKKLKEPKPKIKRRKKQEKDDVIPKEEEGQNAPIVKKGIK